MDEFVDYLREVFELFGPIRARKMFSGYGIYHNGLMFGLVAGYLGGWWDQAISFLANILLSFPVMVLFILILNYLGASGFNIVIAVTFASAPRAKMYSARRSRGPSTTTTPRRS